VYRTGELWRTAPCGPVVGCPVSGCYTEPGSADIGPTHPPWPNPDPCKGKPAPEFP